MSLLIVGKFSETEAVCVCKTGTLSTFHGLRKVGKTNFPSENMNRKYGMR